MTRDLAVMQINRKYRPLREIPKWLAEPIPIAKQMRAIRKALGMTQEQLAHKLNDAQANIAKLERNDRSDPQISTVKRLADALGCEAVIRFVPKKEIQKDLEERSERLARKLVSGSAANMGMELQKPARWVIKNEIERLKAWILQHKRAMLWDEDKR